MNRRWMIRARLGIAAAVMLMTCTGGKTPVEAAAPAAGGQQAQEAAGPQMPRAVNPNDPAVRAIVGSQPNSPAQWIKAALALDALGEIQLGRWFLKQAIDSNPSEDQLASLAEEFGSGTFLGMAGRAQLQPEGRQLAEAVLDAAARRWRDPQRIAAMIDQLADPEPQKRADALRGLLRAGAAAAGALASALADPGRSVDRPVLRGALMHFGDDAVEPLVALLDQPDATVQQPAIHMLVMLNAERAAPELLAVCHDPTADAQVRRAALEGFRQLTGRTLGAIEASRLLREKAQQYLDGKLPVRGDVLGRTDLWRWDAQARRCVMHTVGTDDAARAIAVRLARKAASISPGDQQAQVVRLAAMFEQAAYDNRLQPLPTEILRPMVASESVYRLEGVLHWAMEHGRPAAATVAAQAIGLVAADSQGPGSRVAIPWEQLLRRGSQPAPLVMALRYPDRRLRIAAAEAIVQLRPGQNFVGASYLSQTLAFFAGYSGVRRALSAAPTLAVAHDNAAWLANDGLRVEVALTGAEALRRLLACPDYELALIDACIDRPGLDHFLQQLRRDPRTADLRVGIVARAGSFEAAERAASCYALTVDIVRTHTERDFRHQIARVAAMAEREFVAHQQRQQQALKALELLAWVAGQAKGLLDLPQVEPAVLAALENPASQQAAIAVAELLPTHRSQAALVELASRPDQPAAVRRWAATAFAGSIQRHGILLTAAEIGRQYDRYNQSAEADAETQRVLGALLDAIEAPTEHLRAAAASRDQ